jgi:hypothetical protein
MCSRFLIYLNRVNAVAAYRGYRDTPQIGTLPTTPCEERVKDDPNAFCGPQGACL